MICFTSKEEGLREESKKDKDEETLQVAQVGNWVKNSSVTMPEQIPDLMRCFHGLRIDNSYLFSST